MGASAVLAAVLVIPAFAADTAGTSSAMMMHPKMTVNGTCMAAAVTARQGALTAALTALSTAIVTRDTALSAAWTNDTDPKKRKTDLMAANKAFAGSWKTFAASVKTARATFASAVKACKVPSGDADPGSVSSPSATLGL